MTPSSQAAPCSAAPPSSSTDVMPRADNASSPARMVPSAVTIRAPRRSSGARTAARAAASATIREAAARGYTEIGWICDADNKPSVAVAQNLGFQLRHEDPTYYAFFDPVINCGAHGNGRFRQGQYREAIGWYEKALSRGDGPIWLFWNAACAYAHVGNRAKVFTNLNRAIDAGFTDRLALEQAEHFQALHASAPWLALLASCLLYTSPSPRD